VSLKPKMGGEWGGGDSKEGRGRTRGPEAQTAAAIIDILRFFYLCVCVPSAENFWIALDALCCCCCWCWCSCCWPRPVSLYISPFPHSPPHGSTHLMRIYRRMRSASPFAGSRLRQRIKSGQQRRRKWKGKRTRIECSAAMESPLLMALKSGPPNRTSPKSTFASVPCVTSFKIPYSHVLYNSFDLYTL